MVDDPYYVGVLQLLDRINLAAEPFVGLSGLGSLEGF